RRKLVTSSLAIVRAALNVAKPSTTRSSASCSPGSRRKRCASAPAAARPPTNADAITAYAPYGGRRVATVTRDTLSRMPQLKTSSLYSPTGDQPTAIEELSAGLFGGERYQTLLGATGTGKTATMAWIIEKVGKPALVIAHNKT